jgi:hypothetical protein
VWWRSGERRSRKVMVGVWLKKKNNKNKKGI